MMCIGESGAEDFQLKALVVNLSFLCAFRAVRHCTSLWYDSTVRKRLEKDACEVLQLTRTAHEHVKKREEGLYKKLVALDDLCMWCKEGILRMHEFEKLKQELLLLTT